jgi:guanylate kinase
MKKFTIIAGKSASGKDTILQQILKISTCKPIVSTTSRPKRDNEQEGKDYYYISKDEFIDLIEENAFIEYRKYNTLVNGEKDTWYYGIRKNNKYLDNVHYIVVLDFEGARSFINHYGADNCKLCYIYCDDDKRKERAMKRPNFDETEWNRRSEDDAKKLSLKTFIEDFRDVETEIFDNINENNYIQIAKDIVSRS